MEKAGGSGPPAFLSTHPSPDTRQQKLAALIPQMMPYYESTQVRPVYKLTPANYVGGAGQQTPAG